MNRVRSISCRRSAGVVEVRLNVRVYPKSSRNTVSWSDEQGLKVWVTAAPENGKANDAVVKLLADRLGIPRSGIRMLRGQRTRNKVLFFEGFTSEDLARRIGQAG